MDITLFYKFLHYQEQHMTSYHLLHFCVSLQYFFDIPCDKVFAHAAMCQSVTLPAIDCNWVENHEKKIQGLLIHFAKKNTKQAEAEVVPSSSLVEA